MTRSLKVWMVGAAVIMATLAHAQTGGILPRLLDKKRAAPVAVWTVQGRVVHVADGDTLTLLAEGNKRLVIRLSDIDAPETGHGHKRPAQPYSRRSKDYLAALVAGRSVIAECYDVDARITDKGDVRERSVCQVWQGDVNVGQAMLDAGMAFANRRSPKFIRNSQTLSREALARSMRRGLWAQDNPIEPWVWRDACWRGGSCRGVGSGD